MKFTLPQIMVNMGFTSTNAQLLSAPPYIAGAISALCVSKVADRYFWRLPFIVGPLLSVLTAYAVLFNFSAKIAANVALCYTFVFVALISLYPVVSPRQFLRTRFVANRRTDSPFHRCLERTHGHSTIFPTRRKEQWELPI